MPIFQTRSFFFGFDSLINSFLGSFLGVKNLPWFFLGIHNFCWYSMIFLDFLCFFSLGFSRTPVGLFLGQESGVLTQESWLRTLPRFGSRFFLVVKNLSSVYVTVYFREYKYRPKDSIIGRYRLAIALWLSLGDIFNRPGVAGAVIQTFLSFYFK